MIFWRSAFIILRLSWRQTRPYWRLFLALGAGALLSVSLISQVPIYFRLLEQSGLRHAIDSQKLTLIDLQITSQGRSIHKTDYEKTLQLVEANFAPRLGFLRRSQERLGNTPSFVLRPPGSTRPLDQEPNKGYFLFKTSLDEHIIVQKGRMPKPSRVAQGGDITLEGAIGTWAARLTNLDVGSAVTLVPFTSDPSRRIQLQIVGLIEPRDFSEEYWLSNTSYFFADVSGQDQAVTLPVFITEDDFFQNLGQRLPTLLVNYWWDVYIDGSKINADNYKEVRSAFKEVGTNISKVIPRTLFFTGYNNLIEQYEQKLFFLRAPLLLVVLMIEALIFYYLWTVSSALVKEQEEDMARIKSRGGAGAHILSLYLTQGLLLVAFGLILGPPLSLLLTRFASLLGAFPLLKSRIPITAELTANVFGFASLAAFVSLAAIIIPAIEASKRGIVEYKAMRAHPAQRPWIQQTYLDLVIIVVGVLLYWLISSGRGFVFRGLLEGVALDLLMIFSPTLLLVAGVLILLRILPTIVRLVSRLMKPDTKVWVIAALRHLRLEPLNYANIVALLILATSIGTFAASFGRTLEHNYNERAPYEVGADVRLQTPRGWLGDLLATVPYLPEAQHITYAYRKFGTAGTGASLPNLTLLAVEPDKFPATAWFRPDFAQESLRSLMFTIQAPYSGKLSERALPGEPKRIGLWVNPQEPYRDLIMWIRLKGADNKYYTYPLAVLNFKGWRFLETELLSPEDSKSAYPLKVSSVFLSGDRFSSIGPTGSVELDDIQVVLGEGKSQTKEIVDGFTETEGWQTFPVLAFLQDSLSIIKVPGGDGSALRFAWFTPITAVPRGIFGGDVEAPIPVIASQSFVEGSTFQLKEQAVISIEGKNVPVVIRGTTQYFPTLDPSRDPFLIADMSKLEAYLKLLPAPEEGIANEAWISFAPSANREGGLKRLEANIPNAFTIFSRDQIIRESQNDPLEAGGWSGFLTITYFSLTLVVILMVLIHAYLQSRQRKTENSILKLWGFSRHQLLALVLLESCVILITSFVVGILLGLFTGWRVASVLNFTERGAPVVPPLILGINWQAISLLLFVWLALALLTSAILAVSAFKASLATSLRLAE